MKKQSIVAFILSLLLVFYSFPASANTATNTAIAAGNYNYAYSYIDTNGDDIAIVSSDDGRMRIVRVYVNGSLIQKA